MSRLAHCPDVFGSSPRVRGKLAGHMLSTVLLRIIPARAGQTATGHPAYLATPDHPRACGANTIRRVQARLLLGSSPRVRGKLIIRLWVALVIRIIPARAGQTLGGSLENNSKPDHPRACGANIGVDVSDTLGGGSSPRVRGKLCMKHGSRLRTRIIPARAGQTVRFYAKTLERWTLNNWIRTVAPIFVLLFLLPVIGQNAYIERHYSNQSFSWFSKLHYASAFDLSLVA